MLSVQPHNCGSQCTVRTHAACPALRTGSTPVGTHCSWHIPSARVHAPLSPSDFQVREDIIKNFQMGNSMHGMPLRAGAGVTPRGANSRGSLGVWTGSTWRNQGPGSPLETRDEDSTACQSLSWLPHVALILTRTLM